MGASPIVAGPMSTPDVACRRCGASLAAAPAIFDVSRRCVVCGYVTALPIKAVVELPLGDLVDWLPAAAALLGDQTDPIQAQRAVTELQNALIIWLMGQVDADPAASLQWLATFLTKAEGLSEEAEARASQDLSRPYRIAQLMYALLLRRGTPDFGWQAKEGGPFPMKTAYGILGDLSVLITANTLARRGLSRISIRDGHLILERTSEDFELLEHGHNVAVSKPGGAPVRLTLFDADFLQAQELVFGHSFDQILAMIDPERPDSGLAGADLDGLTMIDLSRCTAASRRTVEAFSLTAGRLRRFRAPYFFDAGPVGQPLKSEINLVVRAGEFMWLAYYPFLEVLAARRPPTSAAITTSPLLVWMLATAQSSEASLLAALQKHAKTRGLATRAKAAEVFRSRHADLEAQVAERFRSAGMLALSPVASLGGRELSCGEIDVLCAGQPTAEPAPLLVVCEVKNVDVPLQKDYGYENLSRTMERAQAQVARKAAWVGEHWRELAPSLELTGSVSPWVIGLIVTRSKVPLPLLGRWPGSPVVEVPGTATHLLTQPVSAWRADLARGIVKRGAE